MMNLNTIPNIDLYSVIAGIVILIGAVIYIISYIRKPKDNSIYDVLLMASFVALIMAAALIFGGSSNMVKDTPLTHNPLIGQTELPNGMR